MTSFILLLHRRQSSRNDWYKKRKSGTTRRNCVIGGRHTTRNKLSYYALRLTTCAAKQTLAPRIRPCSTTLSTSGSTARQVASNSKCKDHHQQRKLVCLEKN